MAKKAIGKVRTGSKKAMAKVIMPLKCAKKGTYSFQETMVTIFMQ